MESETKTAGSAAPKQILKELWLTQRDCNPTHSDRFPAPRSGRRHDVCSADLVVIYSHGRQLRYKDRLQQPSDGWEWCPSCPEPNRRWNGACDLLALHPALLYVLGCDAELPPVVPAVVVGWGIRSGSSPRGPSNVTLSIDCFPSSELKLRMPESGIKIKSCTDVVYRKGNYSKASFRLELEVDCRGFDLETHAPALCFLNELQEIHHKLALEYPGLNPKTPVPVPAAPPAEEKAAKKAMAQPDVPAGCFLERKVDGTTEICQPPTRAYNWRYVLRPTRKLERRRQVGWQPFVEGADRRDGWDT